MKYRKKPVEVEVWQWEGNSLFVNSPDWVFDAYENGDIDEYIDYDDESDSYLEIDTFEGTQIARHGDYIIKDVKGEIYPCKPDIFEATYEEVK